MHRIRVTLTSAFAAVLMTSGCDGAEPATAPEPSTSTHPAPGEGPDLHATVTQSRINEGTRLINAQITNYDSSTVIVASVALKSAHNLALPPTPKETVFAPGRTIDLATELGDPICDRLAATDNPAFRLGLADGQLIDVPLDAAGVATLDRFDTRECALARIADVASIEFGSSFSRSVTRMGTFLQGALVVERPDDAQAAGTLDRALRVEELQGSVLVRLLPRQGSVPAVLEPGQHALRIPIRLGAYRCDEHARGQSSQTFLLSVFVRDRVTSPTDQAQRVIVVPDRRLQLQTLALIDDVCD